MQTSRPEGVNRFQRKGEPLRALQRGKFDEEINH